MRTRLHVPLLALTALLAATPLLAQVEIERRKPAPARGRLSIDSDFGSVTVRAWDQREILVRGTLAAGADGLDFDAEKDEASVEVEVPEAWLHATGEDAAFRSELEIFAPAAWSIEIETSNAALVVEGFSGRIEADSVNGTVRVAGPSAQIEVESMTGAITVEARAAAMELSTISGAIVARGATGETDIETVSGTVDVVGSSLRALQIESTTGKVEVRGSLAPSGEIGIETFSGPVRLVLPQDVRTSFDVESFSGEIKSDFCAGTPLVREHFEPFRKLRCSTGGEESEIQIRTHGGDIAIATE